jgi:hypothetical protein
LTVKKKAMDLPIFNKLCEEMNKHYEREEREMRKKKK